MESLATIALWNAVGATALAAVAALAACFCRRPAVLHALWLLVLIKLVTPPLWSIPIPGTSPEPPKVKSDYVSVEQQKDVPFLKDPIADLPDVPARDVVIPSPAPMEAKEPAVPEIAPMLSSPWSWAQFLQVGWAVVVLLFWALTAVRVMRFRRVLSRLVPAPKEMQQRAQCLSTRLGLARSPLVYLVAGPISPMVWAFERRQRLLLPSELWNNLDEQKRDLLIAHELIHLRRRDHFVRLFEIIVVGLYWWWPIAWLARRRLQETAELCCDTSVIAAFPDAADEYAAALVESASYLSRVNPPLPAGASGLGPVPLLRRRITMVLSGDKSLRFTWVGVVAILAAGVLLLPFWPTKAETPEEAPQNLGSGISEQSEKSSNDPEKQGAVPPQFVPGVGMPVPADGAPVYIGNPKAELRNEVELLEAKLKIEKARLDVAEAEYKSDALRLDYFTKLQQAQGVEDPVVAQLKQDVEVRESAVQVQIAQLKYVELQLRQARRRIDEVTPIMAPAPPVKKDEKAKSKDSTTMEQLTKLDSLVKEQQALLKEMQAGVSSSGKWGTLRKTSITLKGRPVYRLEVEREADLFAVPIPGLSLEDQVDKKVGLFGTQIEMDTGKYTLVIYLEPTYLGIAQPDIGIKKR